MFFANNILKLLALSLALLLLLSSVNVSIDLHFCQSHLKSFSLIGKAKNCHELAKEKASCPHHKKDLALTGGTSCAEDQEMKDCCRNQTIHVQSEIDEPILHFDFFTPKLQNFVVALVFTLFSDFLNQEQEFIPFAHYKPPLIQKDLPVLFESFLL